MSSPITDIGSAFGIGGQPGQTPSQALVAGGYNPNIDPAVVAQLAQNRKAQQQLQALQLAQAMGTGPSATSAATTAATNAGVKGALAAAGTARGNQNPAQALYDASGNAAAMESGAASKIGEMKAAEMGAGEAGLGATLANENQASLAQGSLAQTAQSPVAQLALAKEAQQSAFGQQVLGGLISAASGGMAQGLGGGGGGGGGGGFGATAGGAGGGAGGFGTVAPSMEGSIDSGAMLLAAHGAVVPGMKTGGAAKHPIDVQTGEHGPEILLALGGHHGPRLIDHPQMLHLGAHGPVAVLPLTKGAAPYHPGPQPSHTSPLPAKAPPADFRSHIKPEAVAAMAGKGAVHNPGGGALPLAPNVAPAIHKALQPVNGKHPMLPAAVEAVDKKRKKAA
jgi:hypothetical protein